MTESEALRLRLASVGIFLDEPAPRPRSQAAERPSAEPVDRAKVYAILMRAGAPRADLKWLTASCPSLDHALAYRPPKPLSSHQAIVADSQSHKGDLP